MAQDYDKRPEISIAPMMDWTDRHCRYFHRLISPHALLYTEMVTTGALIHGDRERFLRFHDTEHPVALQLGGSDPDDLARCTMMGQEQGYDEVNLNCGCPSDRVQSGRFGAVLMKDPAHVAACVKAMQAGVDIPVTVKCRLGVDDQDDFAFIDQFVSEVAAVGCTKIIIHARKCWLKGLSPKENRDIPPLDYERVYQVKEKYPELTIIINGGVKSAEECQEHLKYVDGVMIGREAYYNPYMLAEVERKIFGNHTILGREKIARAMIDYALYEAESFGTPVKHIAKHITGLFHHQPGAKIWRHIVASRSHEEDATGDIFEEALRERAKSLG